MRLNKPIGIYLLMWPMLWAFLISSEGSPSVIYLFLFLIGVILTRSAGCVINDYFDRDLDAQVERTKDRMLVSGQVTSYEAIILFVGLIALSILLLMLIGLDILVYALAAFCLLVIYPISKRYIKIPQLVLGIAFGSSIPMVYIVETGETSLSCLLIYLATISWAIAYEKDDIRIGNKSSAILFGEKDTIYPFYFHILTLVILMVVGVINNLGLIFYFSLALALLVSTYQKILVSNRLPYQCISAFENNNIFGLIVFFGLLLSYLYE
jgi:4-hydroxybenzoate polyprenyltransferase